MTIRFEQGDFNCVLPKPSGITTIDMNRFKTNMLSDGNPSSLNNSQHYFKHIFKFKNVLDMIQIQKLIELYLLQNRQFKLYQDNSTDFIDVYIVGKLKFKLLHSKIDKFTDLSIEIYE